MYPGTIFSRNPSDEQLRPFGFSGVHMKAPPQNTDVFKYVEEVQPSMEMTDGEEVFTQKWDLLDVSAKSAVTITENYLKNRFEEVSEEPVNFKGTQWRNRLDMALLVNGKAELLTYTGEEFGFFIDANGVPVQLTIDEMKRLAVRLATAYDSANEYFYSKYAEVSKAKTVEECRLLYADIEKWV